MVSNTPADDTTPTSVTTQSELPDANPSDVANYVQAIYEVTSTLLDRVDLLETKLSTLISVLSNNASIQGGNSEDVNDMGIIIQGQSNIIQALITSDGLSDQSRKNLGGVLQRLEDYTDIEAAKSRIAHRRQQRDLLEE